MEIVLHLDTFDTCKAFFMNVSHLVRIELPKLADFSMAILPTNIPRWSFDIFKICLQVGIKFTTI